MSKHSKYNWTMMGAGRQRHTPLNCAISAGLENKLFYRSSGRKCPCMTCYYWRRVLKISTSLSLANIHWMGAAVVYLLRCWRKTTEFSEEKRTRGQMQVSLGQIPFISPAGQDSNLSTGLTPLGLSQGQMTTWDGCLLKTGNQYNIPWFRALVSEEMTAS